MVKNRIIIFQKVTEMSLFGTKTNVDLASLDLHGQAVGDIILRADFDGGQLSAANSVLNP